MDRETRKANLKKLQLPKTSSNKQQRKNCQTSRTPTTMTISEYFSTPEKRKSSRLQQGERDDSVARFSSIPKNDKPTQNIPETSDIPLKTAHRGRPKRTKLDAFIFKDPKIHKIVSNKDTQQFLNDDDLIVPEKKAKKAPPKLQSNIGNQSKRSGRPKKSKKQTTIKSAFLRNEQLFAEITAQHCAADQFDGEDVQMALAISKSEAESKGIICGNELDGGDDDLEDVNKKSELIREKLKKYGFRTSNEKDYNTFAAAFLPGCSNRRPKSKWANKFTALTLRNPENQVKKLNRNIEELLDKQFSTTSTSEQKQDLPVFKLQSSLLKKSLAHDGKTIVEYFQSFKQSNDSYFVKDLFEVNVLPAGHLLKDWTAIQGRDLTPKTKNFECIGRLQKLENTYQELEAYFSSRKCLNWATDDDVTINEMQVVVKAINVEEDKNGSSNEEEKKASKATVETEVGEVQSGKIDYITEGKHESCKTENVINEVNSEHSEIDEIRQNVRDQRNKENYTGEENIRSDISMDSSAATYINCLETDHKAYNQATSCEKKIQKLLPTSVSLDIMQVSSCTFNTQATINTTQKVRASSPDLFADSDVEMEGYDKDMKRENAVVTGLGVNISKSRSGNGYIEDLQTGVITYEIFSSDEVKNTSPSVQNDTVIQGVSISNTPQITNEGTVIDLTQDDMMSPSGHSQTNRKQCSSKVIAEVDLFDVSLLQEDHCELLDISSNPNHSKHGDQKPEETFKFTLSLERCVNVNNRSKDSSKFSLSDDGKDQYNVLNGNDCVDDEDMLLREIAMDSTNTSFLNFQGAKQLETHFHKETAILQNKVDQEDTFLRDKSKNQTNNTFTHNQCSKEIEPISHNETRVAEKIDNFHSHLKGNDTIFRELCDKYLKDVVDVTTTSSEKQKTDLEKSFSLILPTTEAPQMYENYTNFTIDFDMTVERNATFRRKSASFIDKTSEQKINDHKIMLPRTKSFNTNKSIASIDLTQDDVKGDVDSASVIEGDDDDDDDDDIYLLLSDDEINYSIWQANKTNRNSENSEQSDLDDVISIPDIESEQNDDEKNVNNQENIKEFFQTEDKPQITDLLTGEQTYSDVEISKNKDESLTKEELPPDKYYSEFETLNAKCATPRKTLSDDLKFDRSEFGILEEYSEPIDYTTTLCTPTKVLKDASFLNSPTETTAPMKRFSSCHKSSKKFYDLINNAGNQSPPCTSTSYLNDYDEFDRMVCTSTLKNIQSSCRKPQGIEQLLTAEISFKESFTPTITPIEKPTTPIKVSTEYQEIQCNNKTYTIRYTNSPKPDYTKCSEAELLKQLYNFGIKPLKRKQAVKMLEYIYNQTHPIIIEEEDTIEKQEDDVLIVDEFQRTSISKVDLTTGHLLTKPADDLEKENENNLRETACNKLNLKDSCGLDMLRYSMDLKAEFLDENFILQTNVTKKTPRPLLPLHIAWYNLVCSNRNLHEAILMYEPIDLQEIYLFLKSLGYRYDPKDLKVFFDSRCIIFRYDLSAASESSGKTKATNRHVRKSKKISQKSVKNN